MDIYQKFETNPMQRELLKAQTAKTQYEASPEYQAQKQAEEKAKAENLAASTEYYKTQAGQKKAETEKTKKETTEIGKTPKTQEEVNKLFAKEYSDYVARGGDADVQKNLGLLDESIARLKEPGNNLTGRSAGALAKFGGGVVGQDTIDLQQNVESVVQGALRQTLGAQFTEKEGQQVLARAFNPMLSPEVNVARLERTRAAIAQMAKSKADAMAYFEANGTMAGYKAKIPNMSDVLNTLDQQNKAEEKNLTNLVSKKESPTMNMINGAQSQQQSGYKVGDIVDGYRFNGGDPAQQSSWVKVK